MSEVARLALEERARRATLWRPSQGLFAQQRRFVEDSSRFKAAVCSRRAGKTLAAVHYLLGVALGRAGALCLYIALTRLSAKRILWRELVKLNAKHKLGASFNASELTVELPNGSQVVLTGAQEEADIEKWRGSPYDLVVIDEAASFGPHIETLVLEVLQPALMDHKGTLALIGTPNARCAGWFHDVTTGVRPGWSTHKWTMLDNPFMPPDIAQELEMLKVQHGWTEQTPAYLREMRGLWVRSDDDLVYAYDPTRNDFDELPEGHAWEHVLGVDVGFRDRTAFVVLAWSEACPAAYVIHAEHHAKLIPSTIAPIITRLKDKYAARVVMDCGALGVGYAEEFRQRHGLIIEAAQKTEKMVAIEHLNDDLRAGRLFIRDEGPLPEELKVLQYDTRGQARDPNARKEDPHQPNDLCDALLYAHRMSRHYWYRPEVEQRRVEPLDDWAERYAAAQNRRDTEWVSQGEEWTG